MSRELIVYGVNCVWWDSIDKTARVPGTERSGMGGLPCCPHCGSVLFQMDETEWFASIDRHEARFPGYRAMMEWSRGKCFPDYDMLEAEYQKQSDNA